MRLSYAAGIFCSLLFLAGCKKDNPNKPPVADAGSLASIILPTDSVTLNGSGSDADGQVVAYLWSQVSGPNTPTIATAGSAISVVHGFTFGTYIFQLMVVDNEGATGVDTVSLFVNRPPVDSLQFTADGNTSYLDLTYAGNSSSDYTDPQSPGLDAAAWTRSGQPDILRASLKFDLSKLPVNIEVQSAQLNLYSDPTPNNGNLIDANYGTDNSISIQRVVGNWDMNSGWFSQPSTTSDDQVIIPHTSQSQLDLIGIDVTKMVAAMYSGSNNGFMIRLIHEDEFTSRLFCGIRHTDATKHPSLKVIFKYH